jgi:hypothetical protein
MADIPKFTNLTSINKWASTRGRKSQLASAMSFLDAEIQREALILESRLASTERGKGMTAAARTEESVEDAIRHFVDEINGFLENGKPSPLSPWDVFLFRRRVAAWAVASRLYEVENPNDTSPS